MRSYEKNRVPHIVFGNHTMEQAGRRLKAFGVTNCLIVTGPNLAKMEMMERLIHSIQTEGILCDVYDRCQPDPPDSSCLEVRSLIQKNHYDGIVGFGGGSNIDTAKVACLMAGINGEIRDLHEYGRQGTKLEETVKRPAALVAIPTTSGTGAECTATGVITSTEHQLKFSIGNENAVPDLAIIDPTLTLGMPSHSTVCCGMDVLGHCIEMALGTGSNEYTNLIVMDCIARVWKWLPIAVEKPYDMEAREQLSWAAHNALCNGGMANGHAVAHAIGALYHIVHGHAVAMTVPTVIRHFAEAPENQEKIEMLARQMEVEVTGNAIEDGNRAADEFLAFYKRLGLRPLVPAMEEQGLYDDREDFIGKAVPLVLDDFKSKLWLPPIHDNWKALENVLGMIYDER